MIGSDITRSRRSDDLLHRSSSRRKVLLGVGFTEATGRNRDGTRVTLQDVRS